MPEGSGLETVWGKEINGLIGARVTGGKYRKVMFIGGTDTGKTFLLRRLADGLSGSGKRVGVLDFDLGQSTVGPPGCLGLQLPWKEDDDPLFPTAMVFLGFLSPAFDVGSVIEAGLRLEKRAAEEGCEVLLIETSGMVEGGLAGLLKRSKIRALRPDLLVVLDREGETDHILRGLEETSYGETVKISPSPEAQRRKREERASYRRELFRRYFSGGGELSLDLRRVEVITSSPRMATLADSLEEGRLVGLNDGRGMTLALGRVIDAGGNRVSLYTPFTGSEGDIRTLVVGPSLILEEGTLRLQSSGSG